MDKHQPQLDFFDFTIGSIPGSRALERQHTRPLADDAARERIKRDLDASLFVEAAAGAGKTTALVSRVVALIGAGKARLDRIVAVTFTDRASGEMKLRLRREIEEARREAEERGELEVRRRFDAAVRQLEVARIGTIHAFCADLLRERPVEAGVDPMFRVLAEEEAARLLDRAFDDWFEAALEDPPPGVRRALRRPADRWRRRGPRRELRDAARTLVEHRDFPSPWSRPEGFDHAAAVDRALELLRELAAFAQAPKRPKSWLAKGFRKVARFVEEVDRREEVAPRDHDLLEVEIAALLDERRVGWEYAGPRIELWSDGLRLEDVKARRDAIRAELEALRRDAEADLAARLREELRPVVAGYQEEKRREGALDFLDLLLRARDLVRDDDGVRGELQRRFTHFFVDEFQDTDPLQAEILLLLAADDPAETDFRAVRPVPGKLFVVGDPKQSIYGFRRADVRIYEETKRRLLERGTDLVRLTTSFRGVPGIQDAVNAAFSEHIRPAEDGSQAEYVPLERFREPTGEQPSVVALPAPDPWGKYGDVVRYAVSESYADAVGAFIRWLVEESGWRVTEPGRPDRPVELRYRHVCILSRRLQSQYTEVMRPYVRALEAREVPHVLVGGKGFHEREEVLALRNALTAIEWPDDALSVYATLRGPLFALNDARLLAFRHRHGSLHPLAPVVTRHEVDGPEGEEGEASEHEPGGDGGAPADGAPIADEDRPVVQALSILARLHRGRNRRPIAATLSDLLASVRAHAGIAVWPAGEQALANCLRVVDRAREFERGGASSFRAFVDLLEGEAERGEGEDAPIVEEGTRGVRIMSVHRAKGLEFPVVILADPTCNATLADPSRHVDPARGLWAERICGLLPRDVLEHRDEEEAREHAEAVRLGYVAATRARDLLVAPAVGVGKELEGWAEFLNPAVYPEDEARDAPAAAEAPGCPELGAWTVAREDAGADGASDDSGRNGGGSGGGGGAPGSRLEPVEVRPGLHASRAGTEVVWWGAAALDLGREEAVGIRQQEILRADGAEEVSTAGIRAYEAWAARREAMLEAGGRPELRVVTATARARAVLEAAGGLSRATGGDGAADRAGPADADRSAAAAGDATETGAGEATEASLPVETVRIPRPEGDRQRPGGARFGDLVHRALAVVDLDAGEDDVRALVRAQGRVIGASEEEVAAAVERVSSALVHPLLRRAAAAAGEGGLRRETPVFLRTGEAEVLEGVVDLAFRERAAARPASGNAGGPATEPVPDTEAPWSWTVVDFKTDREVDVAAAAYESQVRDYVRAVGAATGETARGVLLVL